MTSYKISAEIEKEIEKLDNAGLIEIRFSENTFKFSERALNFFDRLNPEYSRAVYALLIVGEAVGVLSAEAVADWKIRRAEYESSLK